jgi:predicted dehydrogenase
MPIRIGLIGSGKIAVANHIPGLSFCRDAIVTALADPNPTALAEASAVTGVTRTYADPFALLKDAPVDAVIIATPNRFHRDLAVAAAESGRHVLCEKPLAMTVEEAEEMVTAAERLDGASGWRKPAPARSATCCRIGSISRTSWSARCGA